MKISLSRRTLLLVFIILAFPAASQAAADSTSYAKLLTRVASNKGVRWHKWGAEEKKLLDEYLEAVGTAGPDLKSNPNEQMAFWVNAHNACVMKLIADHRPVTDVMAIPGFRDQLKCKIAGSERSLVEIESGILRPTFGEPRIHFLLWWGAKGGPRLQGTPYDGATLPQALEEQTQRFIGDPHYVKLVEGSPARAKLSPIFDWYKGDFGKKDYDVLSFIRKYLPKEKAKKFPERMVEISFMSFDWKLDQAP